MAGPVPVGEAYRSYQIKGLKELNQFLAEFPEKFKNNVLRGAARAAAKPIHDEIQGRIPVSDPSGESVQKYGLYAGAMRDSLRVSTSFKGDRFVAKIRVGGKVRGGKAVVFYAYMVEYKGAKEHPIRVEKTGEGFRRDKSRNALFFGGVFAEWVLHPGFRPQPFMRPSLDAKAQEAIVAAANHIKKRLVSKQVFEARDIVVEAEEVED